MMLFAASGRPCFDTSLASLAAIAGAAARRAPMGMAIDAHGRLLVVEDRHKTLLMLVRQPR